MALTTLTLDDAQYATDADLFDAISADFFLLLPDGLKLATGTDGVIARAEPWTLRSASVDFETRGVEPDHPVQMEAAVQTNTVTYSRFGSGEPAFVDEDGVIPGTAPTGGLILRRPGQVTGVGEPYAGTATLTGIKFTVFTFDRQLRNATTRVRGALRTLASDAELNAALTDDDLVELDVARTAQMLYRSKAKVTGTAGTGPDEYAGHSNSFRKDYDDKMLEVAARLGLVSVIETVPGSDGSSSGEAGSTSAPLGVGSYRIVRPESAEWG
jgi:hypothetical protein